MKLVCSKDHEDVCVRICLFMCVCACVYVLQINEIGDVVISYTRGGPKSSRPDPFHEISISLAKHQNILWKVWKQVPSLLNLQVNNIK